MTRPLLLDLFCGAGGAAMGYEQAGFKVVGVDMERQPNYPFAFHKADALEVPLEGFDVIHASPPCQGYVGWQNINATRGAANDWPRLIQPIRQRLEETGVPYVIENVPGSPLRPTLMLCGTMFGLGVRRHRLFESNMLLMGAPRCAHAGTEIAVYGKLDGRRVWTRADGTEVRCASTLEQAQTAMGVDWMTWDELREAIPPAYTQWIGERLLEAIS